MCHRRVPHHGDFHPLPHRVMARGAWVTRGDMRCLAPASAKLEFALCTESHRDRCLGTGSPCPPPAKPPQHAPPLLLAAGRCPNQLFISLNSATDGSHVATFSPTQELDLRSPPGGITQGTQKTRGPAAHGSLQPCYLVSLTSKVGVRFKMADRALDPLPLPKSKWTGKPGKGKVGKEYV